MNFAKLTGSGIYVPRRVVESREIESLYGLEEGWIKERTGIEQRRYCDDDEDVLKIVSEASLAALVDSGATTVDTIIVARDYPSDERNLPIAGYLRRRLEESGYDAKNVDYVDGFHYCSGFISALNEGHLRITSGQSQNVLVVGFSRASEYVEGAPKETAVLWGDGAGAVIMEPSDDEGVLSYRGRGLPSGSDFFSIGKTEGKPHFKMNGKGVYRLIVQDTPVLISDSITESGHGLDDVSLFLFHQANERMLRAIMRRLDQPEEKLFLNIQKYGNTLAASIPIAYYEARKSGKLEDGSLCVLSGFGVGLHTNVLLLRV